MSDDQQPRYTEQDVKRFLANGATLEEAALRGGAFRGLALPRENLRGADLRGADLRNADLRGAILIGADLRGANLHGINLTRADLTNAKLDDAKLDRAILDHALMKNASFKKASLYHTYLRRADIENADFSEATLYEAHLDGVVNATKAKFHKADMTEARVRYAGLDMGELKKVGAKVGSRNPERGWTTNVFNFFKTSWTEFLPHISLLTPFMLIWRAITWIAHILFSPVRLLIGLISKPKSAK